MLPLNPSRIPELFQQARRLQSAGRAGEAAQVYRSILAVKPDLAEVHFQLAQIALSADAPTEAVAHLDKAAGIKPGEAAIWQAYGEVAARLADPTVSTEFLVKAKAARLDPALLVKWQDRLKPRPKKSRTGIGAARPEDVQKAIGLLQSQSFAAAERAASALRKAHPDVAIIADILANAQAALGKFDAAEENYREAGRLDPAYAETRANFARFLIERGRLDDAVAQLKAALEIEPKMPLAMTHLGIALARQNKPKAAIAALRRSLALNPDQVEARVEFGRQLIVERQFAQAEAELRKVQSRALPGADNIVQLGRALAGQGKDTEALAAFDTAIAQAPDGALGYAAKAGLLQSLGQFDVAEALLRKAIALEPHNGSHYQMLMVAHKGAPDDPLIAEMERWYADPKQSVQGRINLGFALAKAFEDGKAYDRVFGYLKPANDLMRQEHPYDIEEHCQNLDRIRAALEDVDFANRKVASCSDFAPIFVTGLPRSGTTLVEQILASHSAVTGGGELGIAYAEAQSALRDPQTRLPRFDRMRDADIARIGHRAEAQMRAQIPDAERITDKGIHSHNLLGLIRLALPRSRFVVVRRDPRDTLLSMYRNLFVPGKHLYSYNLRDLAIYYRQFERVIDFWRRKTPGWFHEIEYEALIADPEVEARKLIAACGLEWEDGCLAFHENKRRVDTLSVHQVRQPLYASSMQAWRRYEADLGELFDALGPEFDPRVAGAAG